jgi:hypothetical protein
LQLVCPDRFWNWLSLVPLHLLQLLWPVLACVAQSVHVCDDALEYLPAEQSAHLSDAMSPEMSVRHDGLVHDDQKLSEAAKSPAHGSRHGCTLQAWRISGTGQAEPPKLAAVIKERARVFDWTPPPHFSLQPPQLDSKALTVQPTAVEAG